MFLPCKFVASLPATTYSIKLKDPATGLFIKNGTTENWNLINTSGSGCNTFSIAAITISPASAVALTVRQL